MNNWIGPTVKCVWGVLHIFLVCHKYRSLLLELIQSSSPSTKELLGKVFRIPWTYLDAYVVTNTALVALMVFMYSWTLPKYVVHAASEMVDIASILLS